MKNAGSNLKKKKKSHFKEDAYVDSATSYQTRGGHRPRWPSRLNYWRSTLTSRAPFGYPD